MTLFYQKNPVLPRGIAGFVAMLASALAGGVAVVARAGDGATEVPATASAAPSASSSAFTPAPATSTAPAEAFVKRAILREFDRFLDHHPLLEDVLRVDPSLMGNLAFLAKTPELRVFLNNNPGVAEGLAHYPRYLLNRALLRQASAPLACDELAPLLDLFVQDSRLELELKAKPTLIRDPAYLKAHPALLDCLVTHPALARVFLPAPSLPRS